MSCTLQKSLAWNLGALIDLAPEVEHFLDKVVLFGRGVHRV